MDTQGEEKSKLFYYRMLECVRRASKSGELPHRLVLNDEVTVVKIAAAYDRLRRLCSVGEWFKHQITFHTVSSAI